MKQTINEKRNKQIGAIVSVVSHAVLIILFLFMVAWRAPDPPLPEIGIELNFGLDEAGSGEIQPDPGTQPSDSDSEEEAKPDGFEENVEEIIEEAENSTSANTQTEDSPSEEVDNATNTQDSPDVVEETNETTQDESEKKEEITKEEPKLPPVLYPNNKTGAGGKEGDSNEAEKANQGDKPGTTGDQGDKDGTVDSRALYGNAGGGGGSSLRMSGWYWDFEPRPKDTSSESGKLVFQIVIDDKGAIVRVKTIESSVSPTVEKIYRDEVMKLTFSKSAGTSVAPSSTGTITFVIKAR